MATGAHSGSMLKTVTYWNVSVSLPVFMCLLLLAHPLLGLFGGAYAKGTAALVILAAGQVFNTATGPLGQMINMSGRAYVTLVNNGVVAALNVGACLLLIPRYGVTGAALSTTGAVTLVNLIKLVQVRLIFGVNPFDRRSARPVLAAAVVCGIVAPAVLLIPWPNSLSEVAACGGVIVLSYCPLFWTLATSPGRPPEDRQPSPSHTGRRAGGGRMIKRRAILVAMLAALTIAAPAFGLAGGPGSRTIVQVDKTWVCSGPVDLDSVSVTMTPRALVTPRTRDAVHLESGCTGKIGRIDVTTSIADGIKVAGGAHDLVIGGGSIRCLAKLPVLHQDGIQVMGGDNITFHGVSIDCGRPNVDLINSDLFISMAGQATTPPTDVVCDECQLGANAAHTVLIQNAIRSGVRDSTLCQAKFPNLTLTIGSLAVDPVTTATRSRRAAHRRPVEAARPAPRSSP